jgi:hypothetical protein
LCEEDVREKHDLSRSDLSHCDRAAIFVASS